MRIFLFLILTICSNIISAQSLNFESMVVEKSTSKPVENAIITIEGTTLAVKTNEEGVFNFKETIPYGEYVVTVTKENYITEYFLIKSEEGKQIRVKKVKIGVTKKEAARRRKIERENAKKEANKIREVKKKKEALARKREELKIRNTIHVVYDSVPPKPEITYTETQQKYSEIIGVPVDSLTNNELYEFIDEWMGVTYLMGGETKDGIDCSSFTQRVYTKVYDLYIERTAEKQYNSKYTDKFTVKENLREGDLMFFEGVGTKSNAITHVGIYLSNNKFVHSTSIRNGGQKGVKVSDITNSFWSRRFVCGGRRIYTE